MKTRLFLALALTASGATARADDWPQFRGTDRTGVSKEKGLLQQWPKEGPKLLWTYGHAGVGFSGPVIIGDTLYTMGGLEDAEYVLAVDLKIQKELWRAKVGPLFSYGKWGDGPRSTPTVAGDRLYALGGYGDLVCLDIKNQGHEVWRKSFLKDLDGEIMSDWGYSESVLVDGDHVICAPGGKSGTLAALKKDNGQLLWRSTELKHLAPFSSAMVHEVAGVRMYVQTSYIDGIKGGFISGFRATDGKVQWSMNLFKRDSYAIASTPIIKDNRVYTTSAEGGAHLFEISEANGAFKARDFYSRAEERVIKNYHGGVVLVGDHVYGHSKPAWACQNLKSGQEAWREANRLSTQSGSIAAADNRLYLCTEDGEVALLVPNPKEWDEVGAFALPEQSKLRATLPTLQSAGVWTHPVIANGRLYLRDQELIFCYDIRAK